MTVDYDLIVIGGSTAATYAAATAARLNARVALVEPPHHQTNWLGYDSLYSQALTHVGYVVEQLRGAAQLGIHSSFTEQTPQPPVLSVQLSEAMEWAQALVSTRSELNSMAVLASLGVDVITGTGEFCRRPYLGFVANNRRLRSRTYLIATGSRPVIPDLEGLHSVGYLTPADIWQNGLNAATENPTASTLQLQGNWVVIGGSPIAIELAQTLTRLNCQVSLISDTRQILPAEDPEISTLLQAQLEAEGVHIFNNSPVTQIRRIDGKKWVQAGDRAIEADEIVLAMGQQPNIESLNLEGVGVQYHQQGIELNEKLQTTNPRIYACGDVAGGYQFAHIAQYEASIALKNALFLPLFKVDYRGIPWAISTTPQVARVGLTEAQARRRYGKDVWVVRHYFKTLDKAQLLGETTGFCKLVVRRKGEILGAHIVGVQASELIATIALAIRQKIKLGAIANTPCISPSLSEIIQKTALEWQQQRLHRNTILQDILEGFFNLRRSWSR